MTDTQPLAAPNIGIDLLDSGEVRLTWKGGVILLRDPTIGDLKKLQRAYYAVPKKITATDAEERTEQLSDAWLGWLRLAVDTLGDAKLPAGKQAEQLPGSWGQMGTAAAFINHWSSVPLPRGVTQT